jgi:hypothetical protein
MVTGPKLPVPLVPTRARSVVSKKTSTPSNAPNPAPKTLTLPVGGPVPRDRDRPGVTVNLAELLPVPPGAVTVIGPVEAAAGTSAVILVSEFTVNVPAAPLNFTAVAPVSPEPLTVTVVPIVPEAGLNEETTGAAAAAGDAEPIRVPMVMARALNADARRRVRMATSCVVWVWAAGMGIASPGTRMMHPSAGHGGRKFLVVGGS